MPGIALRNFALAIIALGSNSLIAGQSGQMAGVPGIVAAGTPIEVVKEDFEAVEGPVPLAEELLFTNNRTLQVLRITRSGEVRVWMENTGGANALTITPEGDIAATCTVDIGICVLAPGRPARVLVSGFEGRPFSRPNDLVASRRGNIYFTDSAPPGAAEAPLPSAVYMLKPGGVLTRITATIARPNGVALSPDERMLYVADTAGEYVIAFDLDSDGNARNQRQFARLALPPRAADGAPAGSGADGLAVDEQGRLYVATALGVQVFSARGTALGTMALPKQPQNLAFGGPDRSWLYVVGRGSVWRIATQTRGPQRAGK